MGASQDNSQGMAREWPKYGQGMAREEIREAPS